MKTLGTKITGISLSLSIIILIGILIQTSIQNNTTSLLENTEIITHTSPHFDLIIMCTLVIALATILKTFGFLDPPKENHDKERV